MMHRKAPIALGRSGFRGLTLVYGLAHLGKSLFWYASELLLAFYLTELAGLSPHQMGLVLCAGLVVSAVIDVVVGARLGRVMPDARSAGRLQLFGAAACAAAFLAITAGVWAPIEWRFAYILTAGLAFRIAYALYDVPQNALMSLGVSDAAARNRVAATRIWFSGLAALIITAAVAPLLSAGQDDLPTYFWVTFGGSAFAVAAAAGLSIALARVEEPANRNPGFVPAARWRPSNTFWLITALMAVTSIATPLFAKTAPFFAAYVLKSPIWGGAVASGMAVGILAGQPIWPLISRRWSLAATLAVAAVIQLVGLSAIAHATTRLAETTLHTFVLAAFLFGLGNGGVGMALWAGFSAVTARQAPGYEGLAFGLLSGVAKLGLSIGAIVLSAVIGGLRHESGDAVALTAMMAGVPAGGALIGLVIACVWTQTATHRSRISP